LVEKAILLDEVRNALVGWIDNHEITSAFDGVFIFGSLINRNGRHFVPQGSMASDVDLVLTFKDEIDTALARAEALKRVRGAVRSLEHETATVLQRATQEPIYSILPLTKYEIHQCIHKGHDPKLFMSNLFLEVVSGERVDGGLASYVDYDYHYENLEAFSAIRLCQSYRNKFLRGNQVGWLAQDDFAGETVFPKEIMRASALLCFASGPKDDESRRTDLEEGQIYLLERLRELKDHSPELKLLVDKVNGRGFTRAESEPLSPEDMLLIHEVMFDDARSLVIPSVRDAIREVIETDMPTDNPPDSAD
jgi:hypothetical protein|tara:strand:- start:288 stop:1208 length:921 start_codon:yes stop_codon:yes gene_type:complete